ncbi:MAG: threonylcarbamoyl-AMP synthase [Proteobacteria bacterium]|nr:MAG: threonylcarbamoyl-AMP synthase [Pseudomonadota bacterium]
MADQEIKQAAELLANGQVVGMPTETVYGLAARIDLPEGIRKIFTTKERPFFDPLIVHIADASDVLSVAAEFPKAAKVLAEKYWPGPLTMILPKRADINPMITAGLDSVGVRVPSHPVAQALIRAAGVPLAAPSANKFGRTSPTTANHVRSEFIAEKVFVLEGGDSSIGIESTVLLIKVVGAQTELSVLRKGHVLRSDIETTLREASVPFQFVDVVDKNVSPGHMKHHYMPAIPLVLCTDLSKSIELLKSEILARLSEMPGEIEEVKIVKPKGEIHKISELLLPTDPVLAARIFYSELRVLAKSGADCLVLYKRSEHLSERWQSLYDRIEKAASLIIS